MKKKIMFMAVIVLVLIVTSFIITENLEGLTSASVVGQKKCVSPRAALNLIDKYGCERIYDDSKCEEQDQVEIQC